MAQKLVRIPTPQPVEPKPKVEEQLTPFDAYKTEPDDYETHYTTWKQNPGPKTMTPLLKALDPVITSAMRTYTGEGSPTLRSQAKLMAADAIGKYDPTKGKLKTHLMFHLQGLRRASAQENQIIGLPERVGLDLYHLNRSEAELRDRLGREPTTQELADHAQMSLKRIAHVRQAQPGMTEGALSAKSIADGDTSGAGPAVVSHDAEQAWQEYVHGDLDPTDKLIMEHTLGMHGRPVLQKKDIAAKLKISPGAVTQRAAKIQEMLDKREKLSTFF
jgi:DNA-directed RNA polymerase specialized sigma subunit